MTVQELYTMANGDYEDMKNRIPKESLIARFIGTYAGSDVYERMMKAYEDKNYEELFRTTHEFKGMAANMSFKQMSGLVSAICEEVRHGAPTVDLAPMIAQVRAEQELFCEAYRKYLESNA